MRITLKNIKHAEFQSHETNCFQATVYVDGKRAFIANNEGFGGCTNFTPLNGASNYKEVDALVRKLDAQFGKQAETIDGTTLHKNLEWVVNDLLVEWLIDKDIKKTLKRICYFKGGSVYVVAAKHKPTPLNLKAIMSANWWKQEYVLLNTLPLAEAKKYFS